MNNSWIVLANAARARIFERDPQGHRLDEVADLVHSQSREHGRDLETDRPGHAQKAHGDAGHAGTAFEPHTDARRREHVAFALEVSHYLEQAVAQGRCAEIALIVSDPFLGELKSHLGTASRRVVHAIVPRDLTSFAGADLTYRVNEALGQVRH